MREAIESSKGVWECLNSTQEYKDLSNDKKIFEAQNPENSLKAQITNKRAEEMFNKLYKLGNLKENEEIGPLNTLPLKRKKRLDERNESSGKNWYKCVFILEFRFNMPKHTYLDSETKDTLKAIKMRDLINPKKFFKRTTNDLPQCFHVYTYIYIYI